MYYIWKLFQINLACLLITSLVLKSLNNFISELRRRSERSFHWKTNSNLNPSKQVQEVVVNFIVCI